MIFKNLSTAALASLSIFMAGAPAASMPEQPVGRDCDSESCRGAQSVSFTPPSFDYDPISKSAPLVKSATWQSIGENAAIVGDYFNALAAFDKAVQLSATLNPNMLEQRGWIQYSLGYEDEAVQDLSKAASLHLENKDFQAHRNALEMRKFVSLELDS